MGVPRLLPLLEEACLLKNMSWAAFKDAGVNSLAVDMSGLIHASLNNHINMLNGLTDQILFDFLVCVGEDILHILRYVQQGYLVFDGHRIDAKRVNEIRAANVQQALAKLRLATNEEDALDWQRQAVHGMATSVAPYIRLLLNYMKGQAPLADRIHVHVALYEADGHIAGLRRSGVIDAAFTVDSDLIVNGVGTVIFTQSLKTGKSRQGHTWRKGMSRVFSSASADEIVKTTDHGFAGLYQRYKLVAVTLLAYFAGNDYVKIKGVGVKRVLSAMLAVEQNNEPMTVQSVAVHLAPVAKLSVEELVVHATTAALYFHCQPVLLGDGPSLQPTVFGPPPSLFPPDVNFRTMWTDHFFRDWTASEWAGWRAGEFDVQASPPSRCRVSLDPHAKAVADKVGETLLVEHGILRSASPPLDGANWLLSRGYTADGDAATLAARQAVKLESFKERAGGFERRPQNREKLDKAELEFHQTELHPALLKAIPYPPASGAFRLNEELILKYFHRDGANTERAANVVHLGEGRITNVKIYKLPTPVGAAVEQVYMFGKARASMKRQDYDISALLCVVGLNVVAVLWAVCMLPKNAKMSSGKVLDNKHHKLCLNRDLCAHGRLLLAEIRIMGLPEGSTDGRRRWGAQEGKVEGTVKSLDLLHHVGFFRPGLAQTSAAASATTAASATAAANATAVASATQVASATAAASATQVASATQAASAAASVTTAVSATSATSATAASAVTTTATATPASAAPVRTTPPASNMDRSQLVQSMKEVATAIAKAGSKEENKRSCVYSDLY